VPHGAYCVRCSVIPRKRCVVSPHRPSISRTGNSNRLCLQCAHKGRVSRHVAGLASHFLWVSDYVLFWRVLTRPINLPDTPRLRTQSSSSTSSFSRTYPIPKSRQASKASLVQFLSTDRPFSFKVSPILPRPELSDLLGIAYRRIPVLAIGNDVYCDSNLIAAELERRFPDRGTLFPPRKQGGRVDPGLIKLFSQHYVDLALFPQGVSLLPWGKFPENFIKDRSEVFVLELLPAHLLEVLNPCAQFRQEIRVERLKASQTVMLSTVASHLVRSDPSLFRMTNVLRSNRRRCWKSNCPTNVNGFSTQRLPV
jgi:hypothetical protein